MSKEFDYACTHTPQGLLLTEEESKKKQKFYEHRFGICCKCENFMIEDFDCTESFIMPLRDTICSKYKEVSE